MTSAVTLTSRNVHVWAIPLDTVDWRERLAATWLSDDELQRAVRFPREQERRRFAVCRSGLRTILSRYLDTRARDLKFREGPYGKPGLDPDEHGVPICFNTSHSNELALVAVSHEHELGVDIEHVRPLDGIDDIVAHHFAPRERLAFDRAAPEARLSIFYRYWTLKEACIKATGFGMRRALHEIDVTDACDRSIRLPHPCPGADNAWWTARALEPASGYVAAVVVEGCERPTLTPLTLAGNAHTVVPTTAANG